MRSLDLELCGPFHSFFSFDLSHRGLRSIIIVFLLTNYIIDKEKKANGQRKAMNKNKLPSV